MNRKIAFWLIARLVGHFPHKSHYDVFKSHSKFYDTNHFFIANMRQKLCLTRDNISYFSRIAYTENQMRDLFEQTENGIGMVRLLTLLQFFYFFLPPSFFYLFEICFLSSAFSCFRFLFSSAFLYPFNPASKDRLPP